MATADWGMYWPDFAFCFLIGGLVGMVELIARYRDAPQRAVLTLPALLYITLNATAAILALWLVRELWPLSAELTEIRKELTFLAAKPDGPAEIVAELLRREFPFRIEEVILAGLGALAVLRASIMKIRVGDTDLSLGPGLIPDILLAATDRAVDRAMAAPRARTVNRIMGSVSFEQAKETLPAHCFRLMQNTTAEEEQQFALEVEALANANMSDKVKALNLGLALLNIVGEKVLQTAVKNLENEFTASSYYMDDVRQHLDNLPFVWVRATLPPLCLSLANATEDKKDEVAFDIEAIESSGLDDWTKKRLLGLVLIKTVGKDVFTSAASELERRRPRQGGDEPRDPDPIVAEPMDTPPPAGG